MSKVSTRNIYGLIEPLTSIDSEPYSRDWRKRGRSSFPVYHLTSTRLKANNNSLLCYQIVPQLRLNVWYLFHTASILMFYMHLIPGASNAFSTDRTFSVLPQREPQEMKPDLHVDVLDPALIFLTVRRNGRRR